MRNMIAVAAVALTLAGCAKKTTQPASSLLSDEVAWTAARTTPEKLAEIAARIKKQPDQSKRILFENGLTEVSFQQEITRVSEDPQASQRYAEAYKRTGI